MRKGFSVSVRLKHLWKDEGGAALIEFTAAAFTFFLLVLGVVEFSNLYYQWNAATKAVQLGARLAAVSNPVANDLLTMTGMTGGALPGGIMPTFDRVCTSSNASGSSGACTNNNSYNASAMQTIVYGRGKTACAAATSDRDVGMCNIFPRINALNVRVQYQYTGLGYAGRPGGPVPTITVSLAGTTRLTYDFILIGGLMNFNPIQIPGFATTATGEDLRKNATGS